jgi:hypothetical protein
VVGILEGEGLLHRQSVGDVQVAQGRDPLRTGGDPVALGLLVGPEGVQMIWLQLLYRTGESHGGGDLAEGL